MYNVKELRKRRKKKRLYKKIKIIITMIILILIANKAIKSYLNKEITASKNKRVIEEVIDSGKTKVILDPGHGGYDTGATYGDIYEKDIVLSISNMVGEILEENDIEVIYTRSYDISLGDDEKEDLKNRVEIANSINAEYFISFHINDYDDYTYGYEEVYGFEVWTDYNDNKSLELGEAIEENLISLDYTECRPMLDGSESLYIIRESNIPSVLIEFGFMSSYNDRLYLSNKENQKLLAKSIASVILENINISAK